MILKTWNNADNLTEKIVKKLQEDEVCYDIEGSEISKFFTGKCVFLTGGTGFLGKLLTEKLLRVCPDICAIYMLVRPKKGKDSHTRIDEIFNDVVYQKLSKQQPKFRHKIILVDGDISLPGLGISIEDRKMIIDKVSIIIHGAATVKFHEKLHLAVDINVKGTKEMLTLAKECKHLDSFVHISTVFTHCYRRDIDEKFYDVPFDTEKIIQICNCTPPQILEKITPDLLGLWPNTYVFTKAIAEDCVRRYSAQLPVCIVRPAVVIATHKEPLRSWIDNIYGATGVVIGSGVGILRAANINKEMNAEIVPADMVVNCVVAASYNTAIERKLEIPIYNYISSTQNTINWNTFMHWNEYYGVLTPSIRCLWIYTLVLFKSKFLYKIYAFLFHLIPGFLMDIGLLLVGKSPQMINVYKKIHNFSEIIQYFGQRNWEFKNDNTQQLYRQLTKPDQKIFYFDMSKLDWQEYFTTHCLGLRTYIIKEDLSGIPQAKKRYFRLQILHYTLKIIGLAIIIRLLYALVLFLFL